MRKFKTEEKNCINHVYYTVKGKKAKLKYGQEDFCAPLLHTPKDKERTISKQYKSTDFYLRDLERYKDKYYVLKSTIDEIGRIEACKEDFSLLKREVMTSHASTEGGKSIVYKYSDKAGVKYLIHEVTDERNCIIHRDFDAVRIASGQVINKKH